MATPAATDIPLEGVAINYGTLGTGKDRYGRVFYETIAPGAFSKSIRRRLKDGRQIKMLVKHSGMPLATTKGGTLNVHDDGKRVMVHAMLDTLNPDAQRVVSAMRRGDVGHLSVGMKVRKEKWGNHRGARHRTILEADLAEVSIASDPGYDDARATLTGTLGGAQTEREREIEIAKARAAKMLL